MRWVIILVLLAGCATGVPREVGPPIEVVFCPEEDCAGTLVDAVTDAVDVRCAFYDLDESGIVEALERASLVLDNQLQRIREDAVYDDDAQLMHDKFCVIDGRMVVTGSMNPTVRGTTLNRNDLLLIPSRTLAQAFREEHDELRSGVFGGGGRSVAVAEVDGVRIRAYFCPDDPCDDLLIARILGAERSVDFMVFSFTDERVADALLVTQVPVRGVVDPSQAAGRYSQVPRLDGFGLDVVRYGGEGKMHHKAWIIDDTVVTGSYNPTEAGAHRNDENMVVVESPLLAAAYRERFETLRGKTI